MWRGEGWKQAGTRERGKRGGDAVAAVVMLARLMLTGRIGAANLQHYPVIRSGPGAGFFLLKTAFPVAVARFSAQALA